MKYILEYFDFLNERKNNDALEYVIKNFDYKFTLTKYNLASLKNARMLGYKKFLTSLESNKLKENFRHNLVFDKIKEIDDMYDRFFSTLCEFRRSILEYEKTYYLKNNKVYKVDSDNELINILTPILEKQDIKNLIISFDINKNNGTYSPDNKTITIYFKTVFKNNDLIFSDFIHSEDSRFYEMVKKISITFFHETVHQFQHALDPIYFINNTRNHDRRMESMVRLNLIDVKQAHLSDEFEIHAFAHQVVKELHDFKNYSYDEILKIVKNPDPFLEKIPIINAYKKLFSDFDPIIYGRFLGEITNVVTKRLLIR